MNRKVLFNLLVVINIIILLIGISAVSLVMAAPGVPHQAADNDDPGVCIPTWTPSPEGTPYITPPPIGSGASMTPSPTISPPPIGGGGATDTPEPTRRK